MKKLLITGVNGFIGSAAKKYFQNEYEVYGIDFVGNADAKTFIIDMESAVTTGLLAEIKPDIVLHAAGGASVSKSLENPKKDFDCSVTIFYLLLESMYQINRHSTIIFLSSAAVYGNAESLPISESAVLKPISPYGLHKKICEEIAEYYRNICNMDIRILRIFSVYGPGLRKQIMWDMYQKFIGDQKIELFGTGDEARDFIYIEDLLQCIYIILNAEANKTQYIYNVANGEAVTIQKVSSVFSDLLCGENRVEFNCIERNGDPDVWKADIRRIERLGYCREVSLEHGIRNYIEWVKRCI